MTQQNQKPSLRACCVYTLVALFLFYEMALQVSPSVMTHDLMRDLKISAAGLGIMSGLYFYTYMIMQIPAGLLFDYFNSRLLIPIAVLLCVSGTLFFASSTTIISGSIGRLLMGVGSAFAFISVLVVASRWFAARYFALLVGIAQLLAAAGAMGGEAPLAAFITSLGWRHALYWLVVAGLVLAMLIWLILSKNNRPQTNHHALSSQQQPVLTSLKQIAHSKQTWWIALYAFCSWAPVTAFAALWGVPFLMQLYHNSNTQAAAAIAMIWLGLGLASPLIGWYSNRIGKRCILLKLTALIGLAASLIIIYLPHPPVWLMFVLLFAFGIATSGQILTFALVKENNPRTLTATAIGFNNMAVVAGGALFQPLIGILLHSHWNGLIIAGTPIYSVHNYRFALATVPLCFLVGWLCSQFFIKETGCT